MPEVLTILSSYVPTCRFVHIKFRAKWSQFLSTILLECVEAPDNETNWQKLFAVSNCVLRACNRGGKKQKRNQDQPFAERFDRWNAGECATLWSEAVSLKQSKRQRTNSIEEISVRAKTLFLQGQYGRAAKVLASEGLAPDNKATFKALEKLHPKVPLPDVSLPDDTASNAFQFSENVVYEQLKTFSKHTAAGPSKMFPEHLQHAVDCTAPDRSEFALKAITKFVNIGSNSHFPVFISKALCCASLKALSKKKSGVRPIAVGELLRRLIAKCLASEAKSEAIELFDSLQLGAGISGGAEVLRRTEACSKIDFQNAFNSVKRSHLLKAIFEFIPGFAAFTNFCYSQHTHHSFITMQSFKVNRLFSMVIRWDRYCSP